MIKAFFSFSTILLIAAYLFVMYLELLQGLSAFFFIVTTIVFAAILAFLILAKIISKIVKTLIVLVLVVIVGSYGLNSYNHMKDIGKEPRRYYHRTNP